MSTPIVLTDPVLTQAYALGQGFDVFGTYDVMRSILRPVLDLDKSGTKTVTFLGQDFTVPACVDFFENTTSYSEKGTYYTREETQDHLSTNVKVGAGYGTFSGQMGLGFGLDLSRSAEYFYTYNNFFNQSAFMDIKNPDQYLTDEFSRAVTALPTTVNRDNIDQFAEFFTRFGPYYTDRIMLGGTMQFYVRINKSAKMTKVQIDAMVGAQYNGLFYSGSIDASVESSAEWKNYTTNSYTNCMVHGGTPETAGALANSVNSDPTDPSQTSVNNFDAWLKTLASDPAIADFQLDGIWNLCGAKRAVVRQAWDLYSTLFHPEVYLSTSSQVITWPNLPTPVPPVVRLMGQPLVPKTPPASPVGYQMVVLNNQADLSNSAIVLNEFFCMAADPSWHRDDLYNAMNAALQNTKGVNQPGNILILSSFGLANNLCPNNAFASTLRRWGAGGVLTNWIEKSDPNSKNGSYWISHPANYCMVGILGTPQGAACELHDDKSNAQELPLEMKCYLFRESIRDTKYTLGW